MILYRARGDHSWLVLEATPAGKACVIGTGSDLKVMVPAGESVLMLQIEKDVPMPAPRARTPKRRTAGARAKYPFAQMEVGDSFFAEDAMQAEIASTACMAGQRLGYRFATRQSVGGVRVWRIS